MITMLYFYSWGDSVRLFVKVMPHDYKRVLLELAADAGAAAGGASTVNAESGPTVQSSSL